MAFGTPENAGEQAISAGSQLGGAVAGQALIPIPGVGSAIGRQAGKLLGRGLNAIENPYLKYGLVGGPLGAGIYAGGEALGLWGGGEDSNKHDVEASTMQRQSGKYAKGGLLMTDPEKDGKKKHSSRGWPKHIVEMENRIIPRVISLRRKGDDMSVKLSNHLLNRLVRAKEDAWGQRKQVTSPKGSGNPPGGHYRNRAEGAKKGLGKILRKGGMVPIPGATSGGPRRVEGPTHKAGGVKVQGANAEVEGGETMDSIKEGEYVFSNELKIPGSDMTFAEMHERIIKQGKDKEKVEKLARLQERVRKNDDNSSSSKKMNAGGFLSTAMSAVGGKEGLKELLPYAGDLINMGRGVFGSTDVGEATTVDASPAQRMQQTRISTRPQVSKAEAATRAITASTGASAAEKQAAHARMLRSISDIGNQANQLEQQARNRGLSLEQKVNAQNARFGDQRRREKNQAEAAKSQMLAQGAAGLSRTAQRQGLADKKQKANIFANVVELGKIPKKDRRAVVNAALRFLPEEYHPAFKSMIESEDYEGAGEVVKNAQASTSNHQVHIPGTTPGINGTANDGIATQNDPLSILGF